MCFLFFRRDFFRWTMFNFQVYPVYPTKNRGDYIYVYGDETGVRKMRTICQVQKWIFYGNSWSLWFFFGMVNFRDPFKMVEIATSKYGMKSRSRIESPGLCLFCCFCWVGGGCLANGWQIACGSIACFFFRPGGLGFKGTPFRYQSLS